MREIYWAEKDYIVNVEKVNGSLLKAFHVTKYEDFLGKLHTIHHRKSKQTFLCPECKKALYTIVKTKDGRFHFRHYKGVHSPSCRIYPYNSLSSNQHILRHFKVSRIEDNSALLLPKKRDFTLEDFDKVLYLLNFYITNVYRYAESPNICNLYKKIGVLIDGQIIYLKDVALAFDKASRSNETGYIYGEILRIYPNKDSTYNVLLGAPEGQSLKKKHYLKISRASYLKILSLNMNLKKRSKVLFRGQKDFESEKAIYLSLSDDKHVFLVKHYMTHSADFVDSFTKLIVTNYLSSSGCRFIIPTPHNVAKDWVSDGIYALPDWAILKKDGRQLFLWIDSYKASGLFSEEEKQMVLDSKTSYFSKLKSVDVVALKKEELTEATASSTKKKIAAINSLLKEKLGNL